MAITVLAIAVLYVGSTILTPLYPIYRREFGMSELAVVEVYAIYVVGNLAVLAAFGRMSDQIGRRVTTLAALALTALSALCFLASKSIDGLLLGRVLNGFAAGLGAGALTAWAAELEPRGDRAHAAVIVSAGNLAGLACGSVAAGLLGQYLPWPLRSIFVAYLALLVLVGLLVYRVGETVANPIRELREVSLRPRIGIPREIRLAFVAPACMALAAFALGGFYASLVPGLITETLHNSNIAVVGGVVGLYFVAAAVIALMTRSLASRLCMLGGTALLFLGVMLLMFAEVRASLPLLLLASLICGGAMALGYRGSLQVVNEIAPDDRRAEVVSTYLLVCYVGNSLPVLGVGLLSASLGRWTAHMSFACVIAALALVAAMTVSRRPSGIPIWIRDGIFKHAGKPRHF
ncbi:MAG: MFS transporter [Proteobacteria bacterium]|nr:MFS transporter [Pseudomonadota bacterium]